MGFKNFIKWFIPFAFIGIIISIVGMSISLALSKDIVPRVIIFGIIMTLLMIFFLVLWIWMIIDVIIRDLDGTEKIIWLLLMIFLGEIISIVYFYVYGKKSLKTKKTVVSNKETNKKINKKTIKKNK